MLDALGLAQGVQKVYETLLANPRAGVTELSALLVRSEADIRADLDVLADLALVRPSREEPGRLLPVDPRMSFKLLVRRQRAELERRHRQIEQSQVAMAGVVAGAIDAGNGLEQLHGLDAIQSRFELLTASAQFEYASLVPGRAISAESLEASRGLDLELLHNGISMRVLYQEAVRNDSVTTSYGQWLVEHGGEVRTAPALPSRMLIVDRATALVPLDPSNPSAGALCTSAPGVVEHMAVLFDQIWSAATPLAGLHPVEPDSGLTPVERELLRLLANGATDQTAANRLGLSLRTVRRIMAELMTRLDATSRFEAGLKAGQRGWL